ncbi:MAG TPA: hypothetical protein PLA97_21900 [Rubrivivax sp.]|nr:hypothetical protein [Rubrivivax sp.]
MTSLIHTAELHEIEPFDYLAALQRHVATVALDPSASMPWNYIEALARAEAAAANAAVAPPDRVAQRQGLAALLARPSILRERDRPRVAVACVGLRAGGEGSFAESTQSADCTWASGANSRD